MQQVQDQIGFKIDTPSDEELLRRFRDDKESSIEKFVTRSASPKLKPSKSQLKKERKAKRKARAKQRV